MAQHAGESLPRQMQAWADLKAAYRFLNNPRVAPEDIGRAHRATTLANCTSGRVILCVQDDTEIHGVKVAGGRGGEEGEVLHSTLAVTTGGELLGILDQRWFGHVEAAQGETPGMRAQRWRETDVWADAVGAVAALGEVPEGCRLVHVADRASDNLRFMHACLNGGHGFVIRAKHDRLVEEGTDKLWPHMEVQPTAGCIQAKIGRQRDKAGRITRQGRTATLQVRYATVHLDPPTNHPDRLEGLTVQAVYLREENPPSGVEAVDWMLLASEPVKSYADASVIVEIYQTRWVVEEWHRVLKEGCALEQSQAATVEALRRLSALLSIIAVRMLQLRDVARGDRQSDSAMLQISVDPIWIQVVALLAKSDPTTLTPAQFWHTVAKRGGFIGRKSDGHPGWKVIWRGWYDISQMVQYAQALHDSKNCG